MYIWNFEVETLWTYDEPDDDGLDETFTVAGENFDKAWSKVQKLALAKSRKFTDTDTDEENGVTKTKTYYPVSTTIVKVERGDWLDG